MKNAWALCKRELGSFFTTPIGYVVSGTFALITGLGFTAAFLFYCRVTQSPSAFAYTSVPNFEETFLSPFLVFCGNVTMFIGPLITMRLLAEEKNQGTVELLLTHPIRDREIVAGKYMASLGMVLIMMAVVAVHLGIINYFTEVEWAVLVFGLLSVFLMAAAFLSMGLFVSSLCNNQITAGTTTFGLFFMFYIMGTFANDMSDANPAPGNWPEPIANFVGSAYLIFKSFLEQLPLDAHAKDMAQGIVQPADIAYYFLFICFFLFMTFRVLESRKWRG